MLNKNEQVTDVSFVLDDGTGRIDVKRWWDVMCCFGSSTKFWTITHMWYMYRPLFPQVKWEVWHWRNGESQVRIKKLVMVIWWQISFYIQQIWERCVVFCLQWWWLCYCHWWSEKLPREASSGCLFRAVITLIFLVGN
jgi:hypothetical protein